MQEKQIILSILNILRKFLHDGNDELTTMFLAI